MLAKQIVQETVQLPVVSVLNLMWGHYNEIGLISCSKWAELCIYCLHGIIVLQHQLIFFSTQPGLLHGTRTVMQRDHKMLTTVTNEDL